MKISKILVPLSNPKYVEDMVRVACNLAKLYKAKIYALHVIETPRSLPLEASLPKETELGESILSKAEQIAEDEYGIEIDTDILQARSASAAILVEAKEKAVDLILLEALGKRTIGERLFGSTVDYVLKRSPCQVWVIKPVVEK